MKYTLLLSLFLVFTGSAAGQKVKVNYNKDFNFGNIKTYSWDRGMAARNPHIDRMIVAGVERELAARGLSKVNADADVIVVYAAAVGIDLNVAYGGRGNSAGAAQQTGIPSADRSWTVPKGSLAITMMDTKSKDLIWSGVATDSLPGEPSSDIEKDAKKMEKPVSRSIEKIFKKYPVPPKSGTN
jgi:hypothetical protein